VKARQGHIILSIQFFEHIFLLLLLLALSFFFSGSETALFSLPHIVAERLKQASGSGKRISNLLEEPNRLLVTILIGNLGANILISSVIGAWVLRVFEPVPYSIYLGSITAIFLTTTVLLLFAEIAPKTLAINAPERFATTVAIPLSIFSKCIYPLLRIVLLLTNSILHVFGVRERANENLLTEKQLKTLVAMGEEEGVLESSERLMIHRIIEFSDTLVGDVFIPRTDMIRVKSETTVGQLTAIMKESGHSRFPVYDKTVDDIKGIVYAKDLFPYYWRGQTSVPISRFMRFAQYIPETKRVYELLREFQSGRIHMAIVVGEYGGTKGIVTLEDLLEEVVGEIFDEYDIRIKELERLPDGSLRVDARLRLDNLSDILGVNVRMSGCDTVAGMAYSLLGHVPVPNDRIEHKGFKFLIEKMKKRRIHTVVISPLTSSEPEPDREVES
jgi:putative hemolysin